MGISGPSRTQDPWLGKNLAFTHNTDLFPCRPAPFNKHSNFKTLFLLQTDESTGGKRGEATSETKKNTARNRVASSAHQAEGDGRQSKEDQPTRRGQKTHAMVKAGGAQTPALQVEPRTARVRGAADSSITTVTANRSHSLPTQSQEIAGRHKHQQKEKKKKVENGDEPAGQEPTAHSQLPSPWSHRDLYQSVATTSMDGWRCANWRCGLEAIQEKAPQNSFVWGAESRRSTPCEATDKCMWSPSSPNFRKARAAGGMEKQVSFHANQSVHGSMPPEDPG